MRTGVRVLIFRFVFCRKIPRDLTEASLSGAGLSIIAALAMVFLFGMVSVIRKHFIRITVNLNCCLLNIYDCTFINILVNCDFSDV